MRQDDGKRRRRKRRRIHKSLRLDFSFPFKGPAVIPPTARGSDSSSSSREKKQAGRHIRCDEFLNPCLHITFLVPSLALLLLLLLIVVVVDSYFYFCSLKNCCAVVCEGFPLFPLLVSFSQGCCCCYCGNEHSKNKKKRNN